MPSDFKPRRQVSQRLQAVANEALAIHDNFSDLTQAIAALLASWPYIADEERKAALSQAFFSNPLLPITASLGELAHFRQNHKHIERERKRHRDKALAQGRVAAPAGILASLELFPEGETSPEEEAALLEEYNKYNQGAKP